MCSCHVIFSFLKCISLSTDETSDVSHTLLFKNVPVYFRTSIPDKQCIPYCWRVLFSNPGYAISCLPVKPFSWASSENIYKTISKNKYGLSLCCSMTPDRTFGVMYEHNFSKVANHHIRYQARHKVGCQPGDCIWPLWFKHSLFPKKMDYVRLRCDISPIWPL